MLARLAFDLREGPAEIQATIRDGKREHCGVDPGTPLPVERSRDGVYGRQAVAREVAHAGEGPAT